jgi:hypothetical protein
MFKSRMFKSGSGNGKELHCMRVKPTPPFEIPAHRSSEITDFAVSRSLRFLPGTIVRPVTVGHGKQAETIQAAVAFLQAGGAVDGSNPGEDGMSPPAHRENAIGSKDRWKSPVIAATSL